MRLKLKKLHELKTINLHLPAISLSQPAKNKEYAEKYMYVYVLLLGFKLVH